MRRGADTADGAKQGRQADGRRRQPTHGRPTGAESHQRQGLPPESHPKQGLAMRPTPDDTLRLTPSSALKRDAAPTQRTAPNEADKPTAEAPADAADGPLGNVQQRAS